MSYNIANRTFQLQEAYMKKGQLLNSFMALCVAVAFFVLLLTHNPLNPTGTITPMSFFLSAWYCWWLGGGVFVVTLMIAWPLIKLVKWVKTRFFSKK